MMNPLLPLFSTTVISTDKGKQTERMDSILPLPANYATALKLIDEAHAQDPRMAEGKGDALPFELDYAQKMTRWLAARCPEASPALQLACRAQHFRRFVSFSQLFFFPTYCFFADCPC
jgi:hypothetical protein